MGEKFNISNLNLYYGDFHALKDVDLSINEKEITAFIRSVRLWKIHLFKSLTAERLVQV